MHHPIVIDSARNIYDEGELHYWQHVGYIYTPYVPLIITPLTGFELIKETYDFKDEARPTGNQFFQRIKRKIGRASRDFQRYVGSKISNLTKRQK